MHRHGLWILGMALILLLCAPVPAGAQQPEEDPPADATTYTEPTDEQIRLNDEAVRTLAAGDSVKAVSLLEEANYLGELNVTFLNLGRAYQQMGKCDKARESFEAVETAPKVRQPSPGFINQKARGFLAELEDQCAHGADDGAVEAPTKAAGDETGGEGVGEVEPPASTSVLGVTAVLSGAFLVGTGVGLHFLAESYRDEVRDADENDDGQIVSVTQAEARDRANSANTLDTVGLSSAVVGAAAVGVGAYLLLSTPDVDVAVRVDGRGARAFCRMRF